MVKGSEIGILGAALRQSHGLSAASEALGLSSRVRRAASSLQEQSEETVAARYGPTKAASLTMRPGASKWGTAPGASNASTWASSTGLRGGR